MTSIITKKEKRSRQEQKDQVSNRDDIMDSSNCDLTRVDPERRRGRKKRDNKEIIDLTTYISEEPPKKVKKSNPAAQVQRKFERVHEVREHMRILHSGQYVDLNRKFTQHPSVIRMYNPEELYEKKVVVPISRQVDCHNDMIFLKVAKAHFFHAFNPWFGIVADEKIHGPPVLNYSKHDTRRIMLNTDRVLHNKGKVDFGKKKAAPGDVIGIKIKDFTLTFSINGTQLNFEENPITLDRDITYKFAVEISHDLGFTIFDPEEEKLKEQRKQELQNDKEYMIQAVQHNRYALDKASATLKDDKDVVTAAVQKDGNALKYASTRLKNDKIMVLDAIQQSGSAIQYASKELRDDAEVMLAAVKKFDIALVYGSKRLRNNKDLVRTAIKCHDNDRTLLMASKQLQNDKEIVLEAVKKNGRSLEYASKRMKNTEEVVLAAVQQRGKSLQHASRRLRNQKRIALAAVNQDGGALQYAFKKLRDDEEVVLAALNNPVHGYYDIFKKASPRLQEKFKYHRHQSRSTT